MCSLMVFVTVFVMIRRETSPIPMGLTPGRLSKGINLLARRSLSMDGSIVSVHNLLVTSAFFFFFFLLWHPLFWFDATRALVIR